MARRNAVIAFVLGAIFGLLQGSGNVQETERLDSLQVDPMFAAIFFGVFGAVGPFLKPPKKHRAFMAFASSAICFSGATSLVLSFPWDFSSVWTIMSIAGIGMGSGTFFRLFRDDVIRRGFPTVG